MKFNASKFELVWYGKEQEKTATHYKLYDDSNIDNKEQVRDLGILIFKRATFTLHIRNIVEKARDKMGWVLRVFQSRKGSLMLALLKSLVIYSLEYYCQLWNPWKARDIQAIEVIQWTFRNKIVAVKHLNYWERLQKLELHSLQRLHECYIIIYIWKITQQYGAKYRWYNVAQNKNQKTSSAWNTVCYRIPNKQKPSTISSKKNAITVFGPRLYNSLSKYLTDIESVKT